MLERKQHVSDEDWLQYFRTVDAIANRSPSRVKPNCVDMLTAKCWQVQDEELRDDAFAALRELVEGIEEVRG